MPALGKCVCVCICGHLLPLGLWNDPLVLHVTLVAKQHPLYIFIRVLEVIPSGDREQKRERKEGNKQHRTENSGWDEVVDDDVHFFFYSAYSEICCCKGLLSSFFFQLGPNQWLHKLVIRLGELLTLLSRRKKYQSSQQKPGINSSSLCCKFELHTQQRGYRQSTVQTRVDVESRQL